MASGLVKDKDNFIKASSQALLDLLIKTEQFEQTYISFYEKQEVLTSDYFLMFRDPRLSLTYKHKRLKTLLTGLKLPKSAEDFMLYYLENDYLYLFREIIEEFLIIARKQIVKHKAILFVAKPITQKAVDRIKAKFVTKFCRKIEFVVSVDPKLAYGLVVLYGDFIYDFSLAGRIKKLKDEIIHA